MRLILYGLMALALDYGRVFLPTTGIHGVQQHFPLPLLTQGKCEVIVGFDGEETLRDCAAYFAENPPSDSRVRIRGGVSTNRGFLLPVPDQHLLRWPSSPLPNRGPWRCDELRPRTAFPVDKDDATTPGDSLRWLAHACDFDRSPRLSSSCAASMLSQRCPVAAAVENLDFATASTCHFVHHDIDDDGDDELLSYRYRIGGSTPSSSARAMADAVELTLDLTEPPVGNGPDGIELLYDDLTRRGRTWRLWLTPTDGRLTLVLLHRPPEPSSGSHNGTYRHFPGQLRVGRYANSQADRTELERNRELTLPLTADWLSCEAELHAANGAQFTVEIGTAKAESTVQPPPWTPWVRIPSISLPGILDLLSDEQRKAADRGQPVVLKVITSTLNPDECMSNSLP